MQTHFKRERVPHHQALNKYGLDISIDVGQNYSPLERITGTYQDGKDRFSVNIVWNPATQKFYEMDVKSIGYNAMIDGIMGRLRDFLPGTARTAPIPQQTREVLVYILREYLQVPVNNPQIQSQLGGLEGLAESHAHQLGGSPKARQLGYKDPRLIGAARDPKKLNP